MEELGVHLQLVDCLTSHFPFPAEEQHHHIQSSAVNLESKMLLYPIEVMVKPMK